MFNPDTVNKLKIEKLIKGLDAKTWKRSLANEFSHLVQGVGHLWQETEKFRGTGTLFFIPRSKVPSNIKVAYTNFICDIRPFNPEKHIVRLTVGGDKLDYEEDSRSPAVSLLRKKIILNSLISDADKGARYCTAGIRKF